MRKHFSHLPTLTTSFVLSGLLLLGCTRTIATQIPASAETTATIDVPTVTETFVPVISKNAQETVIFSYEEDGYAHLFAYIPGKLPLTRLTSGEWDDATPAASPDGKSIAFSSQAVSAARQSGQARIVVTGHTD